MSLRKTPLHGLHVELGARMVPFAGWEMPVQYTGILEEHRAVRTAAGLFDVSHMGELLVTGPQSEAFLNAVVTNDISRLEPGRALYTVVCYKDGGAVDDVIVYMLAKNVYLVCVNAANEEKDTEWFAEIAVGFDVQMQNRSADYALLALQGPKAVHILTQVIGAEAIPPKRFTLRQTKWEAHSITVCRTGYTGEDGCELFVPPAAALTLARTLLEAGRPEGLIPVGLGARDSLRLEAGFPLYGHELDHEVGPLEAGLGWVVKLNKSVDFVGKAALGAQKEAGPLRRIAYFRLHDRRIAREGSPVFLGDTELQVGVVRSGSLSPILNRAIGSVLLDNAALRGKSEPLELTADIRGKRVPLEIATPPLHILDNLS